MQTKLEDIENEIENIRRALTSTSDDSPNRPLLLIYLGSAHGKRFALRNELDDIHKAIEYMSTALTLMSDDHSFIPGLLDALGTSHGQRFQRLGDLSDVDLSIKYAGRAVAMTPDGDPTISSNLANLGVSHINRFKRLGELADVEKAIQYESRALDLIPDGHPDLLTGLGNLGTSHSYRFQRLGELTDLEKAIQYRSRVVDMIPDGHPLMSRMLSNLGSSHSQRFQRLGELADTEKAIQYQTRAADLTPDGHPFLSSILANLGASHMNRFHRLGELSDMERAIMYQSRAVELTPIDHPELSGMLANLALSHSYRFNRLADSADVEKAIQYQTRALDLIPDGHPRLSRTLTHLGASHSWRFQCLGEASDIEKGIQYQARAVDLTPQGHPELATRISNLGSAYEQRFEHSGDLGDLEQVIQRQSHAITLTPIGHPLLALFHSHLAKSYFRYYQRTKDLSHLERSLNSWREATQSPVSAPRDKFRNARQWVKLASQHSELEPIEAYQTTINLLPQSIWLGATTNQRYEDLKLVETLAVDAAYAAILSSNYALALEWLEHARCVVWNQNLILRSPVDQLQSAHPDLASQLQSVASQLHYASTVPRESQALISNSLTPEQVAQKHHSLAQEYDSLLSQARELPGFKDFLLPVKAKNLVRASQNGPIVTINCHRDRCDALILRPGQDEVHHLPLLNFTWEKVKLTCSEIQQSTRSMQSVERGTERRPVIREQTSDFASVLAVLWYDIVKPVLDCLKYTDTLSHEDLPHITWCPTGAITFLPLHAAGDYEKSRSRVFDYVISSYTPTLTALLASTPTIVSPNTRLLAIGQAATPGHNPLPGTTSEIERVKAHAQNIAQYSELMDDQATTTVVLDAMEQHDWVHLACHAHQNVGDATKSGFFMHDGTLDLASINQRSFKNKGLAFLSACQTATGDEKLPDEAVHLASGMLMAGYSSVIATMWSVVDEDAPVVADKVYGQLMKEGKLGNGEAGRALHNAVSELREEVGEKSFARWVPFIHIGS